MQAFVARILEVYANETFASVKYIDTKGEKHELHLFSTGRIMFDDKYLLE